MSALQQTYSYGTPESTDKDGTYMNKTNSEINTEVITVNFQGFPINKFKIEYFFYHQTIHCQVGNTAAAASSDITNTNMITLLVNSYTLQIIIHVTQYSADDCCQILNKNCATTHPHTLNKRVSIKSGNTFFVLYLNKSYVPTQVMLSPYSYILRNSCEQS